MGTAENCGCFFLYLLKVIFEPTLTMRKIINFNIDGSSARISPSSIRWWVIGTFEPALGTSSFSTIDELRTVDPGDTIADISMYYD